MDNTPRCVEAQQKGNIAITEGGAGQDIELGKKLEQSRYTGYFWVARDKKGQTRVRGFFGVYGILEGSQSKHSYIIAKF